MSQGSARTGGRPTVPYRIVVRGQIAPTLSGALEGAIVEQLDDDSALTVEVVDQAHLHSVFQALADRGVAILRLHRLTSVEGMNGR